MDIAGGTLEEWGGEGLRSEQLGILFGFKNGERLTSTW